MLAQIDATREMLQRVFFVWQQSLSREGRHQPYARANACQTGNELVVASQKERDEFHQRGGIAVPLQDLIDPWLVGSATPQDRRLYRVVASSTDALLLSEIAAY